MGDFNFPAIDWNENTGPNSKHICQSKGQAFIDILNDHHMEQMVNFPTRDNHTRDLIVTLLGPIREVCSPDQLGDHEIVSCHLIIRTKHMKTIKRKCYLYNKGHYKMRDDTKMFSKEKYFNGQQNTRNIEDNWKMIKIVCNKQWKSMCHQRYVKKNITTMDNTINQKNDSKT